jgi:hypothetical protein
MQIVLFGVPGYHGLNARSSRGARALPAASPASVSSASGRRRWAAEDVELARKWGEPRALGAALHAQALVKGHQDGEAPLREALQVLEGLARQAGARVVVALGAMLRRYPSASGGAPLRSGL